jgi:hypothetical protein
MVLIQYQLKDAIMIDATTLITVIGGWFALSVPVSLVVGFALNRLSDDTPLPKEMSRVDERRITATIPAISIQN